MTLKFTKEQLKSGLKQAVGGKPFFKVQKALEEAGLGKFLRQPSVSKDQFKKMISALREAKLTQKQASEATRNIEKIVKAEIEKRKAEMAKKTAAVWRQERARRAEEAEKARGAATSALKLQKVATSALERKEAPGRPEVTTSVLRKKEEAKPTQEKPPEPIDLPID